jgi:uncharacterized protein (TIGR02996 family)
MTEEEALLQAVLEEPDEDTPRLIYADWLEEHGDVLRTQFIRVQCELARLPETDKRRPKLEKREHALESRYEPRWRKTLPEWTWYLRIRLRRGFGAIVCTSTPNFLRYAARAFRCFPIQEAELDNVVPYLPRLLRSRYLSRLRSLELWDYGLDTDAARQLAACPHLAQLRELHLRCHDRFGDAAAQALAAAPHLTNLTRFILRSEALGPVGTKRLRRRFGKRLTIRSD